MAATTLRLPEDLHQLVRLAAASRGQSDHAWMLAALRGAILHQARARGQAGAALAAALNRPTRTRTPRQEESSS